MQQTRRRMPSVKRIRNAEKWVANDISKWDYFECFFFFLRDFDEIKVKW